MKKMLVIFVLSVLTLAFSGCAETPEQEAARLLSELAQELEAAFAEAADEFDEPEDEIAPEDIVTVVAGVGDTATIGTWEVTLDSFEFVTWIATSEFFGYNAPEGNQYLYALVTVTNLDTGPRTFMPSFGGNRDISAQIIYNETFTFTRNSLMTYRDELEGRQTNPLTSTTGAVIFAVADRAVESDGVLELRFFTNRDEVVFVLR